jgi:hypothetical protein
MTAAQSGERKLDRLMRGEIAHDAEAEAIERLDHSTAPKSLQRGPSNALI